MMKRLMGLYNVSGKTVSAFIAAAIIFFVSIIVLLAWGSYKTQCQLRQAAIDYFYQKAKKDAMKTGQYFRGLESFAERVTKGRELESFFENKALGMSMEYGLRGSLVAVEKKFQQVYDEARLEEHHEFLFISFIERNGVSLAGVGKTGFGQVNKDRLDKTLADAEAAPRYEIVRHKEGSAIVLIKPYWFKGQLTGWLVAGLDNDALSSSVRPDRSGNSGEVAGVAHEGELKFLSRQDNATDNALIQSLLRNNWPPKEHQPYRLGKMEGNVGELFVMFKLNIEGTPLQLVVATPARLVWGGGSPMAVLVGTLVVAFFCGIILLLLWRTSIRNAVLQSGLAEQQQRRELVENEVRVRTQELSESKEHLEKEIEERIRTESELKQAQAQLLQSEKMASIGLLSAGVAHEINNPLGYIHGNVYMLGEFTSVLGKLFTEYIRLEKMIVNNASDEEIRSQMAVIESMRNLEGIDVILDDLPKLVGETADGVNRVKIIVQNLKRFSHKDEEKEEKVNVHDILDSILSIVANELKHKAEVVKDYGNLPQITCYAQQLGQVFMNLLVNAAQAIDHKGEVLINTWYDAGVVYIKIKDNGCGMSAEVRKHLFEPFYTTKPLGQGTGLGLSVVYGIIQRHKGEILVESEEGKGTSFLVCLPQQASAQSRV